MMTYNLINKIIHKKKIKKKITAITSYDYTMAKLCDQAGIDIVLVGDSAGMVMLGYENTRTVSMKHMCMFTESVSRAIKNSLVVTDLPFMSYRSIPKAVINSNKIINCGANAIKLEGGIEESKKIKAIIDNGIPVMGHIGLQPQTMIDEQNKIKGKTKKEALKLINDALTLEKAGVFCIILEMINQEVAKMITNTINIPTIGIGSGKYCDGQILVIHDLLGLYNDKKFRFVKRYRELSTEIISAIKEYKYDVENKIFPQQKNCFSMDKNEYKKLKLYKM